MSGIDVNLPSRSNQTAYCMGDDYEEEDEDNTNKEDKEDDETGGRARCQEAGGGSRPGETVSGEDD